MTHPPPTDPDVARTFNGYPGSLRKPLAQLRRLILDVAACDPRIGPLQETLKWGQPSYLTPTTKSGSTIRLGVTKEGGYALFAHCQTTIISDFKTLCPTDFRYDGNRAVLFAPDDEEISTDDLGKLRLLIQRALTYHL